MYRKLMIKTFNQLEASEQAVLKQIALLEDFNEEDIYRNGENYFRAVKQEGSTNDFFSIEPFITVKEVKEMILEELPTYEDRN